MAAPPPERVRLRGLHPDDGHDNLNLPRTVLAPGPVPAIPEGLGARWLLVPYLRSYYVHNAGWFIGQDEGCMAGARVDVFLVLYDLAEGRAAWWMEATGRHIQPHVGQPSTAEQEQYLLWAEEQVERALRRGLFR